MFAEYIMHLLNRHITQIDERIPINIMPIRELTTYDQRLNYLDHLGVRSVLLNPNQRGVFCPSTAWACIKVIHCIYLPYYPSLFIHIEPKLSKKEDDIFIYI